MSYRAGMKQCVYFTVAILAVLCGCDEAPPAPVPLRPVRYVTVEPARPDQFRYYSGVARAEVESRLSFKVAGTVTEISVTVGDAVEAGAPIARLNASDYQLQVQQAEAGLTQAAADARNSAATYLRVQQLYENNNASKSELDGARAMAEASAARVRSIEKQFELARKQVEYTQLVAPQAGLISGVPAEVNENVQAGQPIAILSSTEKPEVSISVSEGDIGYLQVGQGALVTLNAIPGGKFSGHITEVGVATARFSTTYPVTIQLDEDDPRVRPGMAAEVRIEFEQTAEQDCFYLPPSAVQEDDRGRFVFVIEGTGDEQGVARRRDVVVGDLGPQGIAVLEGVSAGERVITAGVTRISEGLAVRVPAPEAATP
ncbi:MAG: efflux RND transporter periplasmic adaptor subunit [Candidatus Hydrogenedentes bacterium]|nr:efflux RND transporter periplasmic adaptor subunit [Candidatus Hydrogenedentota bacterium]